MSNPYPPRTMQERILVQLLGMTINFHFQVYQVTHISIYLDRGTLASVLLMELVFVS